jgi:hypothetical protein
MVHQVRYDGDMKVNKQDVQMFGWRVMTKCIACHMYPHGFHDALHTTAKLQNRIDDVISSRPTSDKNGGLLTFPIVITKGSSGPIAGLNIASAIGGVRAD